MANTGDRVTKALKSTSLKNPEKLSKQQEYYKRLTKAGTAKKQTYNLKPVSAI